MAVIRVEKTQDYSVMSNAHFKDKRLSLKAKGLMSQMLSLPDDWDYSIAGLVAINKEEEGAIKSALKELKDAGYLEVVKNNPSKENGGRIDYEYILHEQTNNNQFKINKKQEGKKQAVEIQAVEIQPVENSGELNTNILNTNKLNIKDKNKKLDLVDFMELLKADANIGSDEVLLRAFYHFLNMRKLIKKPIKTEEGLHRLVNRVWKLSGGNHQLANDILEQSVGYEWQDVYPLKEDKQKNDLSPMNEFTALLQEEGYL